MFITKVSFGQTIDFRWKSESENDLRANIQEAINCQPFSANEKLRFVNCVMDKLKACFPGGVKIEASKFFAIKDQYVNECAQDVIHTEIKEWNADSESELEKTFFAKFPVTVDSVTRNRLASCIVGKMKQKFPAGFVIKEGNKKSMDKILLEMAMKCREMINYKGFLRWIPETEAEFVRQIQNYLPDDMPQDLKLSYIKCLKEKLKLKYPEGISFTPETQIEYEALVKKIVEECKSVL